MSAAEVALAFCSAPDPIQWPGAFALVTSVAMICATVLLFRRMS